MKLNLRPTTVHSLCPNAWKYVLFRFDFYRSLSEASIDKHKRYNALFHPKGLLTMHQRRLTVCVTGGRIGKATHHYGTNLLGVTFFVRGVTPVRCMRCWAALCEHLFVLNILLCLRATIE